MVILEIVMILIGLGAVIMSYRITEEKQGEKKDNSEEKTFTEDFPEEDAIREKLDDYKEDMLASASEELSRMSNDKLMGMNEYSEEVLKRMAKNHEEVVFLYDMLKEKEEDIKDLVHHVDSVKALIHDETAKEYQKMMDALNLLQESRITLETEAAAGKSNNKNQNTVETDLSSTQAEKLAMGMELTGQTMKEKAALQEAQDKRESSPASEQLMDEENHNTEIIHLYKEGHSILEISKMLSLGQGEVKFVIDLYENC